MKKFMGVAITLFTALVMVACGKDGSNGGGTGYPTCGAGLVYNVSTGTCVSGYGTPNNQYIKYYDYTLYPNSYQRGNMTIVNSGAYATFLKEALGVCDRNIAGWSTGIYKCDNWISGSLTVQIGIGSNMIPEVRFEAYPVRNNYFNIDFNLGLYGTTAILNPLVLNGTNTFSLINNSKGFEIRAQGSNLNAGGLRLIQIMVRNGTLSQNSFVYEIYYPHNGVATKFATGTFTRYY